METKTGKIESIQQTKGTSAKTNKPYLKYDFQIDGFKYSTFDIGIGESFKIGDVVTMTGEQNGPYWNMNTMVKADDLVQLTPIAKPTEAPKKEFHLSPEQVRTNAIMAAIALHPQAEVDDVLGYAKQFEEYLWNGN